MSYVDSFVQLKFYPPVPTWEYVDQVPEQVRATVFNSSNLKDKGYEVREGFKRLIQVYCTDTNHPAHRNYLDSFWEILKHELTKHYREEEAEILVNLTYFPIQPTEEYVKLLPKPVVEFLATTTEAPTTNPEYDALLVIKLMHHSQAALSIFSSILKQRLINHYVAESLEEKQKELEATLRALHK